MRILLRGIVASTALFAAAVPVSAALKVGDKAPPLTITDWVRGRPIDLATDGAGRVVVLEFWATWCAPCIQLIPDTNEMYRRYKDKGLLLAAVTDSDRGQQLKAVQEFVNQQGKRMDYPVAYDRSQRTSTAYVLGTGSFGIPHAVVIDKRGRIAWFGHPASPEMEQTVRDLLLDQHDPAKIAKRAALGARIEPLRRDFEFAAYRGDWKKCLSVTEAMLEIDQANLDAMRWTILIYLEEMESPSGLRTWAESFSRSRSDNAEALSKLGLLLLAMPNITDRQPDLAVQAAHLARQAAPKTAETMQAVAQVYFQIGDVDAAIDIQRQGVSVANMLDADAAREVLGFYETCRSLRAAGGAD